MRSVFRSVVPASLALLSGACITGEAPASGTDLFEGVATREIGPWVELPTGPWRLGVEPSLVVGGDDPRESHQFVEVTTATRLTDGAVIVADASVSTLRVYGPGGRFRSTLGARGEGPGEFQRPTDILVGPGDSIRVWDQALWRRSTFDDRGAFVRTERYDPTNPDIYPLQGMWPMAVSLGRDDRVLVRLVEKAQKGESRTENDLPAGFALHHVGAGGVHLLGRVPDEETVEVVAPWGPTEVAPPLSAGPEVAFDGIGLTCMGHGSVAQIICVDADGERRGLRWVDRPREVAHEDPALMRWRADAEAMYLEKLGRDQAQEVVSLVPTPRFQPALRGLTIDALGHLWIDVGYDGDVSKRRHLIVGPDMEPLGVMTLPDVDVLEVGEDYVLAVAWTDSGTEQVVVHPLTR